MSVIERDLDRVLDHLKKSRQTMRNLISLTPNEIDAIVIDGCFDRVEEKVKYVRRNFFGLPDHD